MRRQTLPDLGGPNRRGSQERLFRGRAVGFPAARHCSPELGRHSANAPWSPPNFRANCRWHSAASAG